MEARVIHALLSTLHILIRLISRCYVPRWFVYTGNRYQVNAPIDLGWLRIHGWECRFHRLLRSLSLVVSFIHTWWNCHCQTCFRSHVYYEGYSCRKIETYLQGIFDPRGQVNSFRLHHVGNDPYSLVIDTDHRTPN